MKKIYQLLDRLSPRMAFYYFKAKTPAEHLMHSLDHDALKALLKYKEDTGHPQYRKYFNAQYWLQQNVRRALYLGLNRRPPMDVLDIGAGFGYFPYVAKFYGHRVIGIDLPGDTLFNKAAEFLGIDRRDYTIKPKTKMPAYKTDNKKVRFDFVTAFQVCFNGHIEGEIWDAEEWDFFLEDLFKNHMKENGKVYLEMNWSQHIGAWLPNDTEALFKDKYHANFDGASRILLRAP